MALSTYRLSIPVFRRGFGVLSEALHKAEAFAQEQRLAPDTLIGARLAPDMLPLAGQVQRASDTSKNAVVRIIGRPAPSMADDEATFAELQARIARTLAYFDGVDPEAFEGRGETEIVLKFGKVQATLTADEYLLQFALPNFFFHIATAYDILRHAGLPIGKADYLGKFD